MAARVLMDWSLPIVCCLTSCDSLRDFESWESSLILTRQLVQERDSVYMSIDELNL